MSNGESEKLVGAVADRVREVLHEAERRAEEIVAEAEAKAERIVADAEANAARTVERAEADARERVERARKALDELGSALSGGSTRPVGEPEVESREAPSTQPVPAPEPVPEPGEVEEPEAEAAEADVEAAVEPPVEDEPVDEPIAGEPEPAEAGEAASGPSTDELIAQLRAGASEKAADGGGDAAARLVAMNMALDGASREEIDEHLAANFEVANREALIDEVLARVKA